MDEREILLTEFNEGEKGIISRIDGNKNLLSRFASMGIAVGASIKMAQNSGKGLSIMQVTDSRVALGYDEANSIFVTRVIAATNVPEKPARRKILVALAGQPNVGKSTIFNILTGLSQHVGNWPGKTVERKDGAHAAKDALLTIVDLPGTYSLNSQSEEERIARNYMMKKGVDVIVLLVNAAALEHGLYLLSEVLLLNKPVILALNMLDLTQKTGISVDCAALEKALGIPVVPMVATKNHGIRELVSKIVAIVGGEIILSPSLPSVSPDHANEFRQVVELTQGVVDTNMDVHDACGNSRWFATKLMEGDTEVTAHLKSVLPEEKWQALQAVLIKHEDALRAVLNGRYVWIEEVTKKAVSRFQMGEMVLTDRIDRFLTRPIWGIPFLLTFYAVIFFIANTIGLFLQCLIEKGFGYIGVWLEQALISAPALVSGLLVNGVIGGVGLVITFLPVLIIFFASLALFESIGYMARAAFVMDNFMHIIGLHGKSFMPLCIGFGCNVPSVLGARTLETKRERWLTIFLVPFIPCSGRLGLLAIISSAFFGKNALFVFFGLLLLNMLVLLIVGSIANRAVALTEQSHFIMELPIYQMPNWRTIMSNVWIRIRHFLSRAGSLILASSVFVWTISFFPGGGIESSYLAIAGRFLEPLGLPLGFDWKMMAAILTGIMAKENAIATMGVLYSAGSSGVGSALLTAMSPAGALSFMTVLLLMIPCLPTMTVMAKESDGYKLLAANVITMTAIAYISGLLVYRIVIFLGV